MSSANNRAYRRNDVGLSDVARQWVAALPRDVQPLELARRHPHVANRLALTWPNERMTEALFQGLLLDDRGGRKGFAPVIAEELFRLHGYFLSKSAVIPMSSPEWHD